MLLWTGGNGQIQCLNKDTIVQTIILPAVATEIKVTALCVTTNEIYAGTLGDGLYVFDKKGMLVDHLMTTEDENQKNIIQIKEKNGLIWVAYLNGIVTIDPSSKTIKNDFETLIGSNYLYCFYPVSHKEVYVGTSARGVIHIKDGQANTLLEKTTIYSLVKHENSLVIATEDEGLYKIDLDHQKENNVYPIADFNEVLNIIPIDQKLLIATTKNVFLYDEQTKTKCTLPKITNSEMYLNASILSTSNVYIGYDEGILRLDKSRLLALKDLSLRLEMPKLFEEPLQNERHQFKYNENTFSFTYHSNNYYQSSNTFYQYRMLGVDSLWQSSNQTVVNYFDLQPGQYTFEVTSGVYASFERTNVQRYAIVIKPPFWKRPWFILLSIACLLSAIYYFVRRRESRLLAKEKMKQAKLRFELQQLKSQVNPHFLFNSLNSLIGLIEEDSDAAATAAEKMSNLYRNILQYQDIDQISLEEELTLARQYFDIHKLRYYDLITIEVSDYPLKREQFLAALDKFEGQYMNKPEFKDLLALFKGGKTQYQKRILSKVGTKTKVVEINDIAFVYSENRITKAVTFDDKYYVIDYTLDALMKQFQADQFFKISRQVIVNINTIKEMNSYSSNRIKLITAPRANVDIIVSKEKTPLFMEWLQG